MKFFDVLEQLKKEFENDFVVRKNGTLLLGPGKIPNSRHKLFRPLSDENINEFLVSEYTNKFPEEYIEFLKYSNGANLCTVRLKTRKVSFAHALFVIFGLPMTPPFGRPPEMEEPFDLRVEDLARHKKLPKSWLKCGTYTKNYDFDSTYDIFIDTITNKIFSTLKNEVDIIDQWDSLDECFCSIYSSVKDCKEEYGFNSRF